MNLTVSLPVLAACCWLCMRMQVEEAKAKKDEDATCAPVKTPRSGSGGESASAGKATGATLAGGLSGGLKHRQPPTATKAAQEYSVTP